MLEQMPIKRNLLAVACALLAGCATYSPPASGPLAKMKFYTTGGYTYIDSGNSCSTRAQLTSGWGEATELKLDSPILSGVRWGSKEWIAIPAGKPLWIEQGFDTTGLAFGMKCGLAMVFEPQEGESYVANFVLDGAHCNMHIYRVHEPGYLTLEKSSAPARGSSGCL